MKVKLNLQNLKVNLKKFLKKSKIIKFFQKSTNKNLKKKKEVVLIFLLRKNVLFFFICGLHKL
jgi:hypothetical protein